MPKIDMIDKEFGKLKVISFSHVNKQAFWNCKCSCGNNSVARGDGLRAGKIKSCGKCSKVESLIGQTFSMLKVLKLSKTEPRSKWLCKCKCGNKTKVFSHHLKDGTTKSCGCLVVITRNNEKETDPLILVKRDERRRLRGIWKLMLSRCYNKRIKSYANYGARGIKVYFNWKTNFGLYYDFVTKLPNYGKKDKKNQILTIDRIDNNGNYEPGNIRWASYKTQIKNRRVPKNIIFIYYKGENISLYKLYKTLGKKAKKYGKFRDRVVKLGWSVKSALVDL